MMSSMSIVSVLIGKAKSVDYLPRKTGLHKELQESAMVSTGGLVGDEHVHEKCGGVDRAVPMFAECNYPLLRKQFPELHESLQPSGFGENLLVRGLDERTVCVGDEFAVGETILQVASPRAPCLILNKRHGNNRLKQYASEKAMAGWFCRVLKEGRVSVGDEISLLSRPHPEWTLMRLQVALYETTRLSEGTLREILDLKVLAVFQWRDRAQYLQDNAPASPDPITNNIGAPTVSKRLVNCALWLQRTLHRCLITSLTMWTHLL
eukprot:NODE_1775_length_1411_cov_31.167401_g1604_i0.p1 GENE.NODE_1775_length_1411_cov_31.167401_g1604_i0~~NODE_1775_length_1411_cov_31.167401_g1604_i0.p1  ORF type:complete len:264 (+),score=19.09 NODE_1775_length_1411_cov_31.167401_g1604_i0:71-862(+)